MKGLDVPPYRITVEQRAMTVEGWRWIAWEDYAIKDENGVTTEIQAIGRDITTRKQAEIALTESQKKYQSVFDKANDYMVLLDSRGAIIEINERIKTKLGYTREEMAGRNLLELPFLQPESRQKAMENFKKRISGHDVSTYELTFVKKDGTELIGEVNASLVETGNGEIVDLVVIRDITERKKAENERLELINILQQMTEELNTILESIGDAIVTIDNNLTITSVNSAFCTLVGRTFEDIIGKSCSEIIRCSSEKDTESCDDTCGLKESLASSTVRSERSIIQNFEGRLITIEAISSPLRNAEGKVTGAVKSIRDISKEVEVEKMKNEFVSTVSHELRTPLTSIKGYIELILDGDTGDINDIQREFLDIIAQNTDRLTSLINDLLDIEKIESGKIALGKKPVSLTKLVKLAAKTLEPDAHDKKLEYEVTVEDTIEVFADPDRIMQVLMNLISNAIKFTPSGKVSIHVHKHPGRAEIIVSDTGMGISKTDQENLFTKFFRAENALKKQIGGTGLGLSIVKSIVEMHGGSVTVDSTLNRGSTFTVVLPIGEE